MFNELCQKVKSIFKRKRKQREEKNCKKEKQKTKTRRINQQQRQSVLNKLINKFKSAKTINGCRQIKLNVNITVCPRSVAAVFCTTSPVLRSPDDEWLFGFIFFVALFQI